MGNTYPELEAEQARLLAPELPYRLTNLSRPLGQPTPPLPSPIEDLLGAIERHAIAETDSLEAYRRLVQVSADPVVKLLMETIIADEDRHHALLERISASLRDSLNWLHAAESLPEGSTPPAPPASEAINATERFIREEHQDARELRQLARQARRYHDGLYSLLLESMALDSDKHARLLTFIHGRLEQAAH
jgi:hypothetical protein